MWNFFGSGVSSVLRVLMGGGGGGGQQKGRRSKGLFAKFLAILNYGKEKPRITKGTVRKVSQTANYGKIVTASSNNHKSSSNIIVSQELPSIVAAAPPCPPAPNPSLLVALAGLNAELAMMGFDTGISNKLDDREAKEISCDAPLDIITARTNDDVHPNNEML